MCSYFLKMIFFVFLGKYQTLQIFAKLVEALK